MDFKEKVDLICSDGFQKFLKTDADCISGYSYNDIINKDKKNINSSKDNNYYLNEIKELENKVNELFDLYFNFVKKKEESVKIKYNNYEEREQVIIEKNKIFEDRNKIRQDLKTKYSENINFIKKQQDLIN